MSYPSYIPYSNPYGNMNQYVAQQYQQQQYYPVQNQNQIQPQQGLNGKIVDSADVARVTEVPMGSYGIFPKADFSEIYLKSWNNNGTTSLVAFKPIQQEKSENNEALVANNATIQEILTKVNSLENKLENLTSSLDKLSPQQGNKGR